MQRIFKSTQSVVLSDNVGRTAGVVAGRDAESPAIAGSFDKRVWALPLGVTPPDAR